MKKAGVPATKPVSMGCMTRTRKRLLPSITLLKNRVCTWFSVRLQDPSARVAPGTVQPPPAACTQVLPTCQRPSCVLTMARTGEACSMRMRNANMGSAFSGSKSSTWRTGLRSTTTRIKAMPPPVEASLRASSNRGTFIASSAKDGPVMLTAVENSMASWPMNSLRKPGHCMELNGSPPVWSTSAARAKPLPASTAQPNIWRRGKVIFMLISFVCIGRLRAGCAQADPFCRIQPRCGS